MSWLEPMLCYELNACKHRFVYVRCVCLPLCMHVRIHSCIGLAYSNFKVLISTSQILKISNLKYQISNFKFQSLNIPTFQIPNLEFSNLKSHHLKSQISTLKSRIPNLETSNPKVSNLKSQISKPQHPKI